MQSVFGTEWRWGMETGNGTENGQEILYHWDRLRARGSLLFLIPYFQQLVFNIIILVCEMFLNHYLIHSFNKSLLGTGNNDVNKTGSSWL